MINIENSFTHHPPHGTQERRYKSIRAAAKVFAEVVVELCPSSAEKTLAIRRIQEAGMWANCSIACNEDDAQAMGATPLGERKEVPPDEDAGQVQDPAAKPARKKAAQPSRSKK